MGSYHKEKGLTMALALQVKKGAKQGEILPISPGFTYGRGQATVKIADSKVSGTHARVELEGETLVFIDNGSHNGVIVNGTSVKRVKLAEGLIIQLGNTVLEVIEAPLVPVTKITSDDATKAITFAKPQPSQPPMSQEESFLLAVTRAFSGRKETSANLNAFPLPVRLEFIKGVQVQTKWTVAYGPRQIGRYCAEFPIFEIGAPAVCFELSSRDQKIYFTTNVSDKVQLNGKSVPSREIHDGDLISIMNTQIRISLGYEHD